MKNVSNKVKVIAEIGCNHKGDMALAKELIRVAAQECGADVAKFQKRHNRELLPPEQYNQPHPVPKNAYGPTYGAHREFLEFSADQHAELAAYCAQVGIAYSTSVWDLTSAIEMTQTGVSMLKIPSATNQHYALQEYLCREFTGEIHVSTGMSTEQEIADVVDFYDARGRAQDLVIYSCTSGYPVAYKDVCLFEISKLMECFGHRVKGIGFSGHHIGTAPDLAALAIGKMNEASGYGAFTHIERHFTLDCTWKGTDHAASLEPSDMSKLVRELRQVEESLAEKSVDVLPVEQVQRDKLKWRPSAVNAA